MLAADALFTMVLPVTSFSQEKKAKAYLIRATSITGAALSLKAFIDTRMVCLLNNNKFSVHEVNAGTHTFHVQALGKKPDRASERMSIELEEGKTYYIQMVYMGKLILDKLFFQEITTNMGQQILKKCVEDTKCLRTGEGEEEEQ